MCLSTRNISGDGVSGDGCDRMDAGNGERTWPTRFQAPCRGIKFDETPGCPPDEPNSSPLPPVTLITGPQSQKYGRTRKF